jgi:hypothetical protein
MQQAIETQYGKGARLTDDNKIVDSSGKVVAEEVNNDFIKSLVISTETQRIAGEKMAQIPVVLEELKTKLSEEGIIDKTDSNGNPTSYTDKQIEDAIVASIGDPSGASLTEEMVAIMGTVTEDEIRAIYAGSNILQDFFSNEQDAIDAILGASNNAEKSFNEMAEFFNQTQLDTSKLTSGAKEGLMDDNRLGAVYSTGTDEEINEFETRFNALMDNENAEEIASYLNKLDWTNEKDLIKAQYALQNQYGVSAEEAKYFTEAAINATDATTELTNIITEFDAFD